MDDNYALDLVGTFWLSLPKADAISSLINTKGHEASYSAACDSGDWITQATWMDGGFRSMGLQSNLKSGHLSCSVIKGVLFCGRCSFMSQVWRINASTLT